METYIIAHGTSEWTVARNGTVEGSYATREAAFEVVYAAASNAIKKGSGITITIEPPHPGQAPIGGPAA
jgi:hypothetical protein